MDPLLANDIEVSLRTPPSEKLAQALELMATGLRLKRAALRNALPDAAEADIDSAMQAWLFADV